MLVGIWDQNHQMHCVPLRLRNLLTWAVASIIFQTLWIGTGTCTLPTMASPLSWGEDSHFLKGRGPICRGKPITQAAPEYYQPLIPQAFLGFPYQRTPMSCKFSCPLKKEFEKLLHSSLLRIFGPLRSFRFWTIQEAASALVHPNVMSWEPGSTMKLPGFVILGALLIVRSNQWRKVIVSQETGTSRLQPLQFVEIHLSRLEWDFPRAQKGVNCHWIFSVLEGALHLQVGDKELLCAVQTCTPCSLSRQWTIFSTNFNIGSHWTIFSSFLTLSFLGIADLEMSCMSSIFKPKYHHSELLTASSLTVMHPADQRSYPLLNTWSSYVNFFFLVSYTLWGVD